MLVNKKLTAALLTVFMALSVMSCGIGKKSAGIWDKAPKLEEAMAGEWESEDGVYRLTVGANEEGELTQDFYENGTLLVSNNVDNGNYGYANEYGKYEVGNAFYYETWGDMSAQMFFYLDGDKLLFNFAGDWIRMNRVGVSGPLAGHSDEYIELRSDLLGIWWSEQDSCFVEFMNGEGDGMLYFDITIAEDDDKGSEWKYQIGDIIPADQAEGIDTSGFEYVIVARDVKTKEEVLFPITCKKQESLLIDFNNRFIELTSQYAL